MTTPDYDRLLWDESADLSAFIGDSSDDEFDVMSLCEGWRVRDVLSHMIVGHTTPMGKILKDIAAYRGNVPKASAELSRAYGTAHTPAELRTSWAGIVEHRTKRGIAKVIPTKEAFVDHLMHHQDIRRPLGKPRSIPAERLVAALEVLPSIGGFLKSRQRMAGLRWVATDVGVSVGAGPEVRGPAEALVMLAGGRPAALGDVDAGSDGLGLLRDRISPAAKVA